MKKMILAVFFAALLSLNSLSLFASEINDLRVEYLKNPVGIDVAQPRFSWKMSSDARGSKQTAYEIVVSTDQAGTTVVWNSGQIASDKSVHIQYDGLALSPATRYYWKVSVWDNQSQQLTSSESAFFETGLMGTGWGGAQWIKATNNTSGNEDLSGLTQYTIEMDFEIVDVAAGPVFGAKDAGNFFMWQINLEKNQNGRIYFRPHSWQGGGVAGHGDIDITDLLSIHTGETHHLRIEVKDDKASTFIDEVLVDNNRTNPRGGNYGFGAVGLGFRADRSEYNGGNLAEKAYYDNVTVKTEIAGQPQTLFSEDFSNPSNFAFTFGEVQNGRLLVTGPGNYSWRKDLLENPVKFTLEADMTILKDNAAIIFSATDVSHFYMWSFNTKDQAYPLLRRHYQNGGTWAGVADVRINEFTKDDLLNHEHHIRIEVENNVIKTYIDAILVDSYTSSQAQPVPRGVGFRAYKGENPSVDEQAYWDNIVLTDRTDNTNTVVFSENFEGGNNPFNGGSIENVNGNAKFYLSSPNDDTRVFDDSMNGIPLFRTAFELNKAIRSARLYSSGLGIYEVFINGQRIGTPAGDKVIYDEFKPGWTDYSKTIFYTTHDVSAWLTQGANALGAQVSSGWWNGAISHGQYGNVALGFRAKLVIEYTDGTSTVVITDPQSWKTSTEGAVRAASIYDGETYDARRESNWTTAGFDDSNWHPSAINTDFKGQIKAFTAPPVQVRPELERTPATITKYNGITSTGTTYGMINITETKTGSASVTLHAGETLVYDMGQNMVGWVNFKVKGNAGSKMTIRFSEMLNDNGAAGRGNDGPGGSLYRVALRSAKATLYYTLKGDANGEEFHPSTTFYGFRYCDITATQDIEIESLVGQVVGTVAEETSSFATTDTNVNKLYSNVKWGQRGNFLSIPTDCPQRDERLGWAGDIQIFGRTATYNADLASFFHKWMGDMRDSQRSDGAYPSVAPYTWGVPFGAAAWAEAGLVVPWNTYLMYGDKGILEENYESMEKYMTFLSNQAGGGYQYNGPGTDYGDWVAYVGTDKRYISVCYYAYAASLMEKMSLALSQTENDSYAQKAQAYRTLYNNIRTEFQQRYTSSRTGSLTQDTQTAHLLALKFGLLSTDESRQNGINRLKQLIEDNGNRLNTGFVGTGVLNQTLSEVGLTDVAYNLLLQRNNPSWLYSVDQGATTIWERWNSYTTESGFGDVGMNSFNHYAYGAVGEWMFRYMAGINPDENNTGFKHIILTPLPDFRTTFPAGQERITNTTATYESYYGTIGSAWEITSQNTVKYTIRIPANTTATLILNLTNDHSAVYEGETLVSEVEGVLSFRREDTQAIIELQSGVYNFEVRESENSNMEIVENTDLRLYPNPVKDTLYFTNSETNEHIRIFKDNGILVYSQLGNAPINVQSLASGMYFVQMNTGKTTGVWKVIKI